MDSNQWDVTRNNYLPGGVMTMVAGKSHTILNEEKIEIGPLRNWMAMQLEHNNKIIALINMYQIPVTS